MGVFFLCRSTWPQSLAREGVEATKPMCGTTQYLSHFFLPVTLLGICRFLIHL